MKKFLWISRHEMTETQVADLERIMGGPIAMLEWKDTIHDISVLREHVRQVDAVGAVLPIDLLVEILRLADGKPVLRAVSKRVPTRNMITLADGRTEQEFEFVHSYWEQIISIEVKTKRL